MQSANWPVITACQMTTDPHFSSFIGFIIHSRPHHTYTAILFKTWVEITILVSRNEMTPMRQIFQRLIKCKFLPSYLNWNADKSLCSWIENHFWHISTDFCSAKKWSFSRDLLATIAFLTYTYVSTILCAVSKWGKAFVYFNQLRFFYDYTFIYTS